MGLNLLTSLKRFIALFAPRYQPTREELEANTDLLVMEAAMESQERFLVEEATFIGATGIFVGGCVQERPACHFPIGSPSFCHWCWWFRVDPKFQERTNELKAVAQFTCRIVSESAKVGSLSVATAFFISPKILVTAHHAVPAKPGSVVCFQIPGLPLCDKSAENVWLGINGVTRFQCRVKSCPAIPSDVDIACMEIIGKGNCFGFVDCHDESDIPSPEDSPLKIGDPVDVLGYTGAYDEIWLERNHTDVSNPADLMNVAVDILPKWHLAVSYGTVISTGQKLTYSLSTCGGMSGGPVVWKGKVIGYYSPSPEHTLKFVGVHIGVNSEGINQCIALTKQYLEILMKWENPIMLIILIISYSYINNTHTTSQRNLLSFNEI